MAQILIDDTSFDTISDHAQYEWEYQKILFDKGASLFPAHHLVPFSRTIQSDYDARRPDFALIEKAYRSWWIVEVEYAHHDLHRHVLPQVDTFLSGHYSKTDAEYLYGQSPSLDQERLIDLVRGEQPRVVVVVTTLIDEWHRALEVRGVPLMIVEAFRSHQNELALRVNGEHPTAEPSALVSRCDLDPLLPKTYKVQSPGALEVSSGQVITVTVQGQRTRWKRLDTTDSVWLLPADQLLVEMPNQLSLVRNDEGQYEFVNGEQG